MSHVREESVESGASGLARRALRKARSAIAGPPSAIPEPAAPSSPPPEKAQLKRAERRLAKLERRIRRHEQTQAKLAETLLGRAAEDGPQPGDHVLVRRQARLRAAQAAYADHLSNGVPADHALVATVRALLAVNSRHQARAFILGVTGGRGELCDLGFGLVTHDMHQIGEAWTMFQKVGRERLAELAPVEAVSVGLGEGGDEARETALWIAERPEHAASTLSQLAPRLLVTGHPELAQRLADRVRDRWAELSEREQDDFAKLDYWFRPSPVGNPPEEALRLGVIAYHQPDQVRASRNVGDYVQTLAMLGNLARFRGVRFAGADGLGELAAHVQERIRPELELPSDERTVHLVPVSRDFSDGDEIPDETWMIAFGWHMHSSFRLNFGLPYHPNIKPIFVSFHINRVATLDEATVDYLRQNGPIGCRDWTTVDLLLSAGVDAFFTGCLTTTVGAAFPDLDAVDRSPSRTTAVIDLPPAKERDVAGPTTVFTHADPVNRSLGLVEGTRTALELLDTYQRDFDRIVTSRLHSYLPATALGLETEFRPDTIGDVRFDGLLGMSPTAPEFVGMRDGIRELLGEVFHHLLDGADEETFRESWRRRTAPLVAEARQRFAAPRRVLPPEFDVDAAIAAVAADTHVYGPHDRIVEQDVTDVAMSLDQNFKELLPVTVESLTTNASGPVRLWVTARGLDEPYRRWFHQAFPDIPVTFLGCDRIDYGEIARMISHITVATMDRLLLPVLLPQLDRITYVDIDTVTEGDIRELAQIDLAGAPLAGRPGQQSGAVSWRLAGDQLDAERASDLRRWLSARHRFDFVTVNCGVLVLDLARMRRDDFVREFLPLAGLFGLNDQDILNAYAGHERVELEARWNSLPVMEDVSAHPPGILHYAGAGKPWEELLTPAQEKWTEMAARVRKRTGPLPE